MDVQTLNHMPGFARVACDKTVLEQDSVVAEGFSLT